jgi:A/G-specific adenine glycosylase
VLLEKRPPAGVWGGLWCLPEGEDLAAIEARLGLRAAAPAALPAFEHRLSHLRLSIRPVLANGAEATQVQCSADRGWFDAAAQARLGLPQPVTQLLARMNQGEFG